VKKYRVIVTPEAQAGIRQAFEYIYERAPLNAARWLQRLYQRVDTLEHFPERCAFARERQFLEEDLRQLVFQSYRVVFRVDETHHTVYVLYVRHAKRRAIGEPAGDAL
jgi:plasmid stabilization system protein ParE